MGSYACEICGLVYDEEKRLPHEGIQPGTRIEDIPDDWICPIAAHQKRSYSSQIKVYPGVGRGR